MGAIPSLGAERFIWPLQPHGHSMQLRGIPPSTPAPARPAVPHSRVHLAWEETWIHSMCYILKLLKSGLVLLGSECPFRAVILTHNTCTSHSPASFPVIYNFSLKQRTEKKYTQYKSYFTTRILGCLGGSVS